MKQPTTSLLDLPAELWSRICKLAVIYNQPIVVLASKPAPYILSGSEDEYDPNYEVTVSPSEHSIQRSMLLQPPITRVCRAIRAECLSTYYSSNIFYGYDCWDVSKDSSHQHRAMLWLRAIGPVNTAALQSFYYRLNLKGPALLMWFDVMATWVIAGKDEIGLLRSHGYGEEGHAGLMTTIRLKVVRGKGVDASEFGDALVGW